MDFFEWWAEMGRAAFGDGEERLSLGDFDVRFASAAWSSFELHAAYRAYSAGYVGALRGEGE